MNEQELTPEVVVDCRCTTGEGPLWHPAEKRLYWVDIPSSKLYRLDPVSGAHEEFDTGKPVGGYTIQPDGALLLFMANGTIQTWKDGETVTIVEEIPDERDNRFNDVIADPGGRVFCGTMSTPARAGRLYRLDTDRSLAVLLEGIGTSNGMGFTRDLSTMYHTDTRAREIYRYDYDRSTGNITNRRVFAATGGGEVGRPDGLTVDAEDCVWSARWGGHRAVRYSPDGEEIAQVMFPAANVSSVTFGGEDYSDLYVTTAGGNDRDENGEYAGALFRLRPDVGGIAEFPSRIE
ncbi:MAG: SMP-30/gluconolactonase/LRE family protein [Lentisphaerae bacterium]|nr:SMP-30/gluconolactonase/LRE family protein [Lentisphaerota bacterium]